ncbi:Coatomer subunit beta'-2 [Acorus gramineus]|uniref:Coatomer subunit beta'-2 n=1 Tax=Acorus gramineus TaxID=55184 RepID=A0AAV9AM26_ACOGR|nr:Coatomer subunit beta'-2 [Acorus gramineus]
MVEDELEVATDPNYKFDLCIQLARLEVAKEIAVEVQSESKWKQLGELEINQIPEAALIARSYLPNKVWDCSYLEKRSQQAAELLADVEEYPNLFEDWQVALEIESSLADKRISSLKIAEVQEETPLENGDSSHELEEENEGEEHEEAVEVEADDSTDGTVLINGNESDKQWCTNNEGPPSA